MQKILLAFAMWFALSGAAMAAVNINTATKEELTSLKGVGDKRAQDIIDYRTKNGNFKSVDDLEKVPGIGPGLMKQIRPQVTTTGKTVIDQPRHLSPAKAKLPKPIPQKLMPRRRRARKKKPPRSRRPRKKSSTRSNPYNPLRSRRSGLLFPA